MILQEMFSTSIKCEFSSIFFACVFFAFQVQGQSAQVNRYEVPLLVGENNYFKVASFKEKGLILHRTLFAPDSNPIELIKLDTALKEQWKGYIAIDKSLSFFQARTRENFLILLYRHRAMINGNYLAVVINEAKGSYIMYDINNAIPFNPAEFEVTNNALIIVGYFNFRPIVIHYSLETKAAKVLPGYFNERGEITELKTYPNGTFDIILKAKNIAKQKCLWVRNYDAEGTLIKTTVINPEGNKNFISAKSMVTANGEQMIAGMYGRYTEYSRGLFFANINAAGEYGIRFYNFGEMKHFFAFMKPNRERRIKNRIERRKAKGKAVKFSYKFLAHELVPYGKNFLFVGESYSPHYTHPTNYYRSAYTSNYFSANPYLNSYQPYRGDYIFDGYQYTHAIIAGFDRNANLLWDNAFEINDVKNMQLEKMVKVKTDLNKTSLYYLFENSIRSKIIQDSIVIAPKKSEPIKSNTNDEEGVKKDGEANSLEFWYDNYLVAAGVQRLKKPKSGRYGPERRVFFINKIRQ